MKSAHSLEVLFEDQWIIVVGKPSGMLSVGFPGNRSRTAEKILEDMHRSRGKIKIGAVHRLDRDTSGVMMFACTEEARTRIMDEWQDIVSERIYRCVCSRNPAAAPLPESGTIDAPLAYNRSDVAFVPRKGDAKALKDAEKAVTHFRVLVRGLKYDLVECELETGRKNQIRAHMAHLGHPVIGDEVYNGAHPGSDRAQSESPIGRLALHARVLAFTHPFTGTQHRFEIPEPDTFEKIVKRGSKMSAANPSGAKVPGAPQKRGSTQGQSPKYPGLNESGASRSASYKPGDADAEKKIPRRQRGKPVQTGAQEARRQGGRKERESEDFTDLKEVPRKSRTRQETGKSRFIPGK